MTLALAWMLTPKRNELSYGSYLFKITAFAWSRIRMCMVGVKLCNPYVVAFYLIQVLLFCGNLAEWIYI